MDAPERSNTHLTWTNVAIGAFFIVFDATISATLRLNVGLSLLTAAARCVLQLSVMALILGSVFETSSPWGVAGIARMSRSSFESNQENASKCSFAVVLNLLGAIETGSHCILCVCTVQ